MTTFERLRDVAFEVLDVRIEEGDTPQSLGLDSLDIVDLMYNLEDEFDVDLPVTDLTPDISFRGLAGLIDAKLASPH